MEEIFCKVQIGEEEVKEMKNWVKREVGNCVKEELREIGRRLEKIERQVGKGQVESEEEERKRSIILREYTNKMNGLGSTKEKVRRIINEEIGARVRVEEATILAVRGDWMTVKVKLEKEEDKEEVRRARRRIGREATVRIDEDKEVQERIREKDRRRLREGEEGSEDQEGVQ